MRRAELIHIRTLNDLSSITLQELFTRVIGVQFDVETGYGFLRTQLDESTLSSVLVLRKLTYKTMFDPLTNALLRQENAYFESIRFSVDARFGLLEVLASMANTRRVVSVISKLFDYQLSIGDFGYTPVEFLDRITDAGYSHIVTKFSIDNFVAMPGLSGRYSAEVMNPNNGLNLIRKQKGDIDKLTLEMDFESEDGVELTIHRNGGISVTCEEDALPEILTELKVLLFSERVHG